LHDGEILDLLAQVRAAIDKPVAWDDAARIGEHDATTYLLDDEGERALDQLIAILRGRLPEASRFSIDDLRAMIVETILTASDADLDPHAISNLIYDQLQGSIQGFGLFPILSLHLPVERDLQVGDVRFFRITEAARTAYQTQFSRVVRTTHLASGEDPAKAHETIETRASQILRATDTWAEVTVSTRTQSAPWLSSYKLRSALSIVSLMLPLVGKNPEIASILRWYAGPSPLTAHLFLAPDQHFSQSWERVHLRMPVGLSAAEVEAIEANRLFQRAAESCFATSPTDLDVRLANAILLLAQASYSDLIEQKLGVYGTILETLVRARTDWEVKKTLCDRMVLLLKPTDEPELRDGVTRVYEARNDLLHIRADQISRHEVRIVRALNEGRVLVHRAVIAALRRSTVGGTFDQFLDELTT
jgi:hypothetical protein